MNYCSKLLCLFLLLVAKTAFALDLKGLYTTSCAREIGVILGVDKVSVYLLNVKGNVVPIPRYDIVGIASYPINHIPISNISLDQDVGLEINSYRISTKYRNEILPLTEGWPVGFSKDKIAFLDKDGREVAVQRKNIWDIVKVPPIKESTFTNKVNFRYDFVHPVSMSKCPATLEGNPSANAEKIDIVPQEYVSDPITIKRSIDKLLQEHKIIKMYIRSQNFYPVPEVYNNDVSLGFWAVSSSRYGASKNRTNNGAPILVEEFSTGPFGYQHIILTGAAPNSQLIHEEAQTQLYYRFKADYFHLSLFYDPNSILVGKKYRWQTNDVDLGDVRVVEELFVEAGLDFGHFSLMFTPFSSVYYGLKYTDPNNSEVLFESDIEPLSRYGLSYQSHLFYADVTYGEELIGEPVYNDFDFKYYRVNGELNIWEKYRIGYSLIQKNYVYKTFNAQSTANAVYLDYKINFKYLAKGFLAYERTYSSEQGGNNYIKLGAALSIVF